MASETSNLYKAELYQRSANYYWNGSDGQSVTLTWSFASAVPPRLAARGYTDPNLSAFTVEREEGAVAAMRLWEEVANVVFIGSSTSLPGYTRISFSTTDFKRS